jgi:hypothetical protein
VVPSLNGAPKRTLPCAAACAREEVRVDRKIPARRARRAGCGSCARVSARAQSAHEYEPSWAHWLPQQPTQSRLKGSRQARAEQGHARGRDTGFVGSKPAAHLLKPSKTPSSLGDPRRKRTSDQPSKLGGLPPGKSQIYGQDQRSAISASCSVLTVCRLRSCHARAHCVARSQGLAMTPKNGYARAAGTQARAEHHRTAPTTMV